MQKSSSALQPESQPPPPPPPPRVAADATNILTPEERVIQALRRLFQVLTDAQFHSECEMERQRRLVVTAVMAATTTTTAAAAASPAAARLVQQRKIERGHQRLQNGDHDLTAAIVTAKTIATSSPRQRQKQQQKNHSNKNGSIMDNSNNSHVVAAAASRLTAHHKEKSVTSTTSHSKKKRAPSTAGALLDPSNNGKSNYSTTDNTNNNNDNNSNGPSRKKRKIEVGSTTGDTSTTVTPAGTSASTAAAAAAAAAERLPSPSLQRKEPPSASALPAGFPPRLKTPLAIEAATIAASVCGYSVPEKGNTNVDETARSTNDDNGSIKREESREKWDRRYQELFEFKEKHSHLNVPPPHKDKTYMTLYWWIILQKSEWRKFNKGLKSRIDEQQVKRLILIGLGTCDGPAGKFARAQNAPPTAAWNAKFEQLLQFQREHGHIEVPEKKGGEKNEMRDLARWCSKQRKQFMNRQHKATHGTIKDKFSGTMTDVQLTKLASIGFRFTNKVLDWDVRFQFLEQYKKMHGHTRVPKAYSEFANLGDWVMGLRDRYKNNKLRPDRIARLEAIGFEWRLRAPRRPNGSPRLH
jgi:Helicase associated domain